MIIITLFVNIIIIHFLHELLSRIQRHLNMFLFFLENHDGQGGIRYQKREPVEQDVVLKVKYKPSIKDVNKMMVNEKKKLKVILLTTYEEP